MNTHCPHCGSIIVQKEEDKPKQITWVHWVSFVRGTVRQEIANITNMGGTAIFMKGL